MDEDDVYYDVTRERGYRSGQLLGRPRIALSERKS
jgi:hypothetical protein